jgi:tryptophanyl-tRNA synthetase
MIKRMVEYQESSDLFLFIANLHSLTTLQDGPRLKNMTLEAAADLLALGIDPKRCHFWVQSDVPEVAELTWILSCLTPVGLMERAHSYKDKITKGIKPNLGLFCYPTLMTADILINQSEVVPVGKDQKQHVEMARDIAIKFNNQFGDVFKIPQPDILEDVAVIPGTDGQKMSKSYGNTIPIFGSHNEVRKAVMGIVTDSKGVDAKKDPEKCNVFALYKLFATPTERAAMADEYRKGGLGYGDVKKALLEKINETFDPFRKKREQLMGQPGKLERILEDGADKVRKVTLNTLEKVRKKTGLRY